MPEPVAQNQNVEVRDAGGGNKEEFVRNAAGQVVESRTVDANGKVRSRNTVDYQAGYYAPDTATTSYYADGKSVENSVKVTYDPSANFLSELVEQYDQSGKHVNGHKLLHDPVTGEFRCWKWDAETQKYDPRRLPFRRRERREAAAVETDHAGRGQSSCSRRRARRRRPSKSLSA